MRYFNLKSVYGIETIDQISPKDFESYKEFKKELNMLMREYRLAGMNVYISQRCTNDWTKK
jgi:hypothetical protein